MPKDRITTLIALHIMLIVFSMAAVCSKLAGRQEFMSFKFILFYGLVILSLGVYAIGWQQVIKRMPLTAAYANKAITVVWGIIWGIIIFGEHISIGQIIGAVLVIAGVIVYAYADGDNGATKDSADSDIEAGNVDNINVTAINTESEVSDNE